MSTTATTPKFPVHRAPDERFKGEESANDKWAAIKKIDVNSMQLDESYEDNSDPYNSTGRFLVTKPKKRDQS